MLAAGEDAFVDSAMDFVEAGPYLENDFVNDMNDREREAHRVAYGQCERVYIGIDEDGLVRLLNCGQH